MEDELNARALTIREFTPELAHYFREINEQWITAMYSLEAADLEVLTDPIGTIIDPGGAILFVEAEGLGIVGACALKTSGDGEFELTKMGVLESARGRKAGEFLLKAVIARAEAMGARTLYLLSNKKSAVAIHLYEKLGFSHDDDIMRRFGSHYERCDVAMLYTGARAASAALARSSMI
jgi:N-acetylglutamate synthase-like GNAT family acetyltransferase